MANHSSTKRLIKAAFKVFAYKHGMLQDRDQHFGRKNYVPSIGGLKDKTEFQKARKAR